PGEYLNDQTNTCIKCKEGTYQNNKSQLQCIPCPSGTWTRSKGSTSKDDCQLYCKPGFYLNSQSKCAPCPRGYYKEQAGNSSCLPCPNRNSTTANEGTIHSADCNLVVCEAGQFLNKLQERCYSCPAGYYKS
ncbi:hypothetical protein Ahia01_001365900, partial [Argonauta hians]